MAATSEPLAEQVQPIAELERDGDSEGRREGLEAMHAAFREALTDELVEKARNIADVEVARLKLQSVAGCDDGDDLVQTILLRTWEGRIRWRHQEVSLLGHVCDMARHASRRLHALGRTAVHLDRLFEDSPERAEVERALALATPHPGSDPVRAAEVRRIAEATEERLWNLATVLADADVLTALVVVLQGARGEEEIREATGMDVARARRAWRRIRQWIEELPAGLRAQAHELV